MIPMMIPETVMASNICRRVVLILLSLYMMQLPFRYVLTFYGVVNHAEMFGHIEFLFCVQSCTTANQNYSDNGYCCKHTSYHFPCHFVAFLWLT